MVAYKKCIRFLVAYKTLLIVFNYSNLGSFQILKILTNIAMTRQSLVVLVMLALTSLSSASPLQGSGYPHYDTWYQPQHQHPETEELCHTLRLNMDTLLKSKTFRCERLPGEAPGYTSSFCFSVEVRNFCSSAGLVTIRNGRQ